MGSPGQLSVAYCGSRFLRIKVFSQGIKVDLRELHEFQISLFTGSLLSQKCNQLIKLKKLVCESNAIY